MDHTKIELERQVRRALRIYHDGALVGLLTALRRTEPPHDPWQEPFILTGPTLRNHP